MRFSQSCAFFADLVFIIAAPRPGKSILRFSAGGAALLAFGAAQPARILTARKPVDRVNGA